MNKRIIKYNATKMNDALSFMIEHVRAEVFDKIPSPLHLYIVTGQGGLKLIQDNMENSNTSWIEEPYNQGYRHLVTNTVIDVNYNPQLDNMMIHSVLLPGTHIPTASFRCYVFVAGELLFEFHPTMNLDG
jgi:hypothetical protein